MRAHRILSFLWSFILISVGIMAMALPYLEEQRVSFALYLIEHPQPFFAGGLLLFFLGLLLGFSLFIFRPRHSLRVKGAEVSRSLIESAAARYFKESFPTLKAPEVSLSRGGKIRIALDVPEEVRAQVKKELSALLLAQLGYEDDFFLTI